MRDPLIILKSGPEKNIWGWFSVPPYCSPNERCNSESMVGTMNRFENGTLDLFKAGRKSVKRKKV
jgi:hypothetical protein